MLFRSQARKVAFDEQILASGPFVKEIKREGDKLLVSFFDVGEGLKLAFGEEVLGFYVEDAEGQFESVQGVISEKDQITLTIPEGITPVSVRYAWADNPQVNLINSIQLPAMPFRKSF